MEIESKFRPMLTPPEMLSLGIFGGTYFSRLVDHRDFPESWFRDLDEALYCSEKYEITVNHFLIKAGQTQEQWEAKGWIHPDDPRGWFEWYCKYFLGRRHSDDERQIKRWLAFCGPKGRWRNTIYRKIRTAGVDIDQGRTVSPRIQQSLLHWSYLVNDKDYRKWRLEVKG